MMHGHLNVKYFHKVLVIFIMFHIHALKEHADVRVFYIHIYIKQQLHMYKMCCITYYSLKECSSKAAP